MVAFAGNNSSRLRDRLRDLHRLLTEMAHLQEDLLEVLQRKLLAMRTSDVNEIQACVLAEGDLAECLNQRDGLRKQLTGLIVQDLGLDEQQSDTMTIGRLASYLERPQRTRLEAVAARISPLLTEIAKVNRVVTMFAGDMLEHYQLVFGEMTAGLTNSPVYSLQGRGPVGATAQVFDATC